MKPYGSELPKDPKEQFYEDFAKFHKAQVDNHQKTLDIMKNQVENHNKLNSIIDSIAKNHSHYELLIQKTNLLKYAVIAIMICSGFLYMFSFVMLINENYIQFAICLSVAMYLTFVAFKKCTPKH